MASQSQLALALRGRMSSPPDHLNKVALMMDSIMPPSKLDSTDDLMISLLSFSMWREDKRSLLERVLGISPYQQISTLQGVFHDHHQHNHHHPPARVSENCPTAMLSVTATGLETFQSQRVLEPEQQRSRIMMMEQALVVVEKTTSTTTSARSQTSSSLAMKWLSSLDGLRRYKEQHGDCIVPRGYAANPKLASWVAEQRKQYKLFKTGNPSSITIERIRLLNEIGFAWNAQEEAWKRQIGDLLAFSKENGHCHVPLNYKKYPKLGLWVKEQRRHYTLMKQGKRSHMNEERVKVLTDIGFCWDTHEAAWMERFRELVDFKQKYGTCLVPSGYCENPKLGTWVQHQRRQYKRFKEGKSDSYITKERICALEKLGFVWNPREGRSLQVAFKKSPAATCCSPTTRTKSPVVCLRSVSSSSSSSTCSTRSSTSREQMIVPSRKKRRLS